MPHYNPQRRSDEEDSASVGKDQFYVSCSGGQEGGPRLFNIFLYGTILAAEQFIPAVQALQDAGPEDNVIVHLSTGGGSVDATDTFLTALSNTLAKTVMINATGGVHSAGTYILLWAADMGYDIQFSDGFYSMVHTGSFGYGGKLSDFKSAVRFLMDKDEADTWKTYKGFLTDEEIEHLLFGREFWFDAYEFSVRLQKRNDLFAETEE